MWKNSFQRLSIHNIEIKAPIGVFDFEKQKKNTFLVSIDVWADFSKSMISDSLEDSLDYTLLYDIAHRILNQGGDLIEHSAEQISKEIQRLDFPIQKYKILIKKISPPLSGTVSDTSFEIIVEK